jgi:hypothetical protein
MRLDPAGIAVAKEKLCSLSSILMDRVAERNARFVAPKIACSSSIR